MLANSVACFLSFFLFYCVARCCVLSFVVVCCFLRLCLVCGYFGVCYMGYVMLFVMFAL